MKRSPKTTYDNPDDYDRHFLGEFDFPYPIRCIHKHFEETATKFANQIAVQYYDEQLTFSELNEQANLLAHRLIEKGVKKNTPVLLFLNRSPRVMIAIFAILKAGGAYVPVVSKLPKERILSIIKDSNIKYSVSELEFAEILNESIENQFYFDSVENSVDAYPKTNPNLDLLPNQLVNIIYTSGTTGNPKGAMISHASLSSFYYTQQNIFFPNDTNPYRVALSAPINFDFSVLQWVRILAGNTLVIIPEDCRLDGKLFIEYAQKYQIQTAGFTPSEMNMHIQSGFFESLPQLTHLTIGGEAMNTKMWQIVARQTHIRAFNVYGPTECTCYVCCEHITPENELSLGPKLDNTELFVVDENFQELPDGEYGELLIGGLCVGNGYINDEERTNQKFIVSPFDSSKKLYRSGDRICKLPNGKYQYGGRIDRQVKLRGNRIELEEIEHHMLKMDAIIQGTCQLKSKDDQFQFLAAFIKTKDNTVLNSSEIKTFLEQWVPDYMVPSAYVFVDEFALTNNGKIDFKALPQVEEHHFIHEEKTQFSTETEKKLAEIWSKLIGSSEISPADNFFHLGGHSLFATQLVSLVETNLNKKIAIDFIFRFPRLSNLASEIDKLDSGDFEHFIEKNPSTEDSNLAYSQIRLWNIYKVHGANSLFNTPFVIEIRGRISENMLRESLAWLIQRHRALRSHLVESKNEVKVRVASAVDWKLMIHRLPEKTELAKKVLHEIIHNESEYLFNLEAAPLFRFSLIYDQNDTCYLILSFHHLITDGWSMGLFIRELSESYSAFFHQEKPHLPELTFQYTDFCYSRTKFFNSREYEKQEKYWLHELKNLPEIHQLGTDKMRPETQSLRGKTLRFTLNQHDFQSVKQFSAQRGSSNYMTCLSAFFILLQKISSDNDIVVGSVIANRNHKEFENVMGFFSNTLLIRQLVDDDLSVNEFLELITNKNLQAFNHQDMPMDKLLEILKPNRNLAYNPLFQIVFNYQNMPLDDLTIPGASISFLPIHSNTSKVDLTLTLREYRNELLGEFEYATDLFFEKTMELYQSYFGNILKAMVENPEQKISQISIEAHQSILIKPNPYSFRPITEIFEDVAQQFPGNIAIESDHKKLSYKELNELSNQAAHHFLCFGSAVIGFSLPKIPEAFIIILGILKAGKTYLPIDAQLPLAKKQYMIQSSGLELIISEENDYEQSLTLDKFLKEISSLSPANPTVKTKKEEPAYIIFTSGTTGLQKGVVIPHESLSYFTQASADYYHITTADRVLQFASLSFDAAVEEIFPTLCTGATLVLRDDEMMAGNRRFIQKCAEYSLTILDLPTAFWHQLTNDIKQTDIRLLDSMRLIILGGEAVKMDFVKKWFQSVPAGPSLINTYGPTEATVVATNYLISRKALDSVIPIGKPLPHVYAVVADSTGNPVPVGFIGELLLGGDCLAQGYLNLEEQTAGRFITVQINHQNLRFYKTGDSVRLKSDGNLDFLGRKDNQVKIRGFRVETEAIEEVVKKFDGVKDCVIMAQPIHQENLDLVAYIVSDHELDLDQLQKSLSNVLPNYMVPGYFVPLQSIPLTSQNKTDYKSLPLPTTKINSNKEIRIATSPLHQSISRIWSHLLRTENIGIDDNFFQLGGHSLLATQFISLLENDLGQALSLKDFFANPTIELLAAKLVPLKSTAPPTTSLLVKQDINQPIPLTSSQKRMWFLMQLEGASSSYNIPFDFLVEGSFNPEIFYRTLELLMQRHNILNTQIELIANEPRQVILPVVVPDYQFVDLSSLKQDEARAEVLQYSRKNADYTFNLENGPLWRCICIQESPDVFHLLFNFHHVISDGWSVGLFIKELSKLYMLILSAKGDSLPLPRFQYSDFAHYQQAFIKSESVQKQLNYWKTKLADSPELLQLPADFPRKAKQTYQGNELHFTINSQMTQSLKNLAIEHQISINMLMLSAFYILLQKYSHDDDIIIGSPIANRTPGLNDDLMGVFINNLVLRQSVITSVTLNEFYQKTKETLLEAVQNQDAPFESILDGLKLKRNLSISPLFQVMFNYLNAHTESLTFPNARVTYIDTPRNVSKYDFSFIMSERDDEIHVVAEYNTDLFLESRIERFTAHYQRILQLMLKNTNPNIGEIDILSESEKNLIQQKLNQSQVQFPVIKHTHEFFEERTLGNPDKTAIIFLRKVYSYYDLNQKANYMASVLSSTGVKTGSHVGVFLNRSFDLIATLLGILKLGAAYIPLDPVYPKDRIALILEDSAPQLIVSELELLDQLPENEAKCIDIHSLSFQASEVYNNPKVEFNGNTTAYIIYTSGSTGKPKGVVIQHFALSNFLLSMQRQPECNSHDILMAVTTISFDIAGLELYLPLISGASIVLATHQEVLDVRLLKNLMVDYYPTIMQATPAYWKMLILSGWEGNNDLKILCGGEALEQTLAENLASKSHEVWNMYGPTETTIWSTLSKVELKKLSSPRFYHIGRPIANTTVYLVDDQMNQVPIGVRGELLIGGDGLSAGYFNNEPLTTDRFISSPFEKNARLYKTGDLMVINEDFNLEYLERRDQQVKIRGFRIELGEIEMAMKSIEGITDAIVVILTDEKQNKQLIGYYISDKAHLTHNEIIDQLRNKIPDYMIPGHTMSIKSFPKTPNGKINRKELPQPAWQSTISSSKILSFHEDIISKIWEKLLNRSTIDIDDDFFAIGGHSLLATEMMLEIEKITTIRLPLATLFKNSTIRTLAQRIRINEKTSWKSLVQIRPNGTKKALYIVHGAGLNILLFNTLVKKLDPGQPVFGLQAKGLDGSEKPLETIEDIARHYISEIIENDPEGPYLLGGFSLGGIIAFEMNRQFNEMGRKVLMLAMFDTVAYSCILHYSFAKKLNYKFNYTLHQILFNVGQVFRLSLRQNLDFIKYKWRSVIRRFNKIWYNQKVKIATTTISTGEKKELPAYLFNVYEANNKAGDKYIIPQSDIKVTLFRAKNQTFYIEDPKNYGWDKYCIPGVEIREIPGEHNSIFAPPNDELFAKILQEEMDKALKNNL